MFKQISLIVNFIKTKKKFIIFTFNQSDFFSYNIIIIQICLCCSLAIEWLFDSDGCVNCRFQSGFVYLALQPM